MVVKYVQPRSWIRYDAAEIQMALVDAKAAILALRRIPYQRGWVDALQEMELKREVAGTSRIEGADFTEPELDEALREAPDELLTRSQRQAHAAVNTYRWIATVPDDRPIGHELILEMHRRIVTGADDDHCPPGRLRGRDDNVTFGSPRHRGASGGEECADAFDGLARAISAEYRQHDPIIQALAAHYHLAAMHPFLDGNGRTARALEALLLGRGGLRDACFIAMSNYYYDEKTAYLAALAETRRRQHDLTPFLLFSLKGISQQSRRLLSEIRHHLQKAVFRNLMQDLFGRLRSPKKRVIAERQVRILNVLLDDDLVVDDDLYRKLERSYEGLVHPWRAFVRDINGLWQLKAIGVRRRGEKEFAFYPRLEWPTEMSESDFLQRIETLPRAKTFRFLS